MEQIIVELADIGPDGLDLEADLTEEILESQPDDPVRCTEPIHCELHCQIVDHEFLVQGTLSTKTIMHCRRCDCLFPGEIKQLPYHYDQELEPMPESVDLTEDLRESILLAFPSYPVCRETCKGLCAQCGVNLNEETCHCKPPEDARWGDLDRLELGKE
jgi:uncharacterized protein